MNKPQFAVIVLMLEAIQLAAIGKVMGSCVVGGIAALTFIVILFKKD